MRPQVTQSVKRQSIPEPVHCTPSLQTLLQKSIPQHPSSHNTSRKTAHHIVTYGNTMKHTQTAMAFLWGLWHLRQTAPRTSNVTNTSSSSSHIQRRKKVHRHRLENATVGFFQCGQRYRFKPLERFT